MPKPKWRYSGSLGVGSGGHGPIGAGKAESATPGSADTGNLLKNVVMALFNHSPSLQPRGSGLAK